MPEIKTDELSKTSLIAIVDAGRDAHVFRGKLIFAFFRADLISSCKAIVQQQERIDKELKTNRKLSRKASAVLVKKHNQLGRLGNKKLKRLKELDGEV